MILFKRRLIESEREEGEGVDSTLLLLLHHVRLWLCVHVVLHGQVARALSPLTA